VDARSAAVLFTCAAPEGSLQEWMRGLLLYYLHVLPPRLHCRSG